MGKTSAKSATDFSGDEKIVVLAGKDDFLRTQLMLELRQSIQAKGDADVETIRFSGDNAQLAEVLDELRSFGLMQQHKLVVVDDADEFVKRFRDALERYAESPVETATLLLRAEKWNKGNLDKAIAKVGSIVDCEPLSGRDAAGWVAHHAEGAHRVKITPRAAALLVENMGSDRGLLDSEIGKLAAGLAEGQAIDVKEVEALSGRASEEAAWEVQEALLSGEPRRALEKVHELIDLAGQPDVLVMYFVSDLVRKLHHAGVMLRRGGREFDICKAVGIWGDRQRPFMTAAHRLGSARAAKLLDTLVQLDSRAKSGFGDTLGGLERFCVQFCEALG
jgi:DNA polymerase-3 subunit delta